MEKITKLIIVFLAIILISVAGSFFTDTTGWYESVKPKITPPNYVFPIVWTILYIMIALSIYFFWTGKKKAGKDNLKQRKIIFTAFGINLFSNFLWSVLFFGFHLPLVAFIDLIIIWISAIFLSIKLWKIDKKAGILLWPYILWVSFAGLLNFMIAAGMH
ncbi:tryptophan-rich sensory protein [Candidatus Pacearchaeota archaeon]|nr:tryptophan-rich sensory protein [Candidatus Pacearchaeota archaeon]